MAFSVQMPALGESVTEGTVTRWLKQEGDTVERDEPLLEVSTDKVDTEIPAPASGVPRKHGARPPPALRPARGESVTEGTVTRWLKKVGDQVAEDEPLVEVSTDKVDTEIPSPVSGTLLSITAEEDVTVAVGGELAKIGQPGAGTGDAAAKPPPEPGAP